uniref:acetyl-CoA carboxylase biotin carboxyl carrier protein n=1 Tax=uncultured Sphingomonas sp. TaxID=158754 RepID=UPI0035CB3A8E
MANPFPEDAVHALMAEFGRSGVRELHVRHGDFELYLSNDSAGGGMITTVPAHAAPAMRADPVELPTPAVSSEEIALGTLPPDADIVFAPNLGTFYRSPKPGAAFYVELGSEVSIGDELCLIEVMKLFTAVRAEVAGRVHAILAPDGEMVEAGQPLFAIVRT